MSINYGEAAALGVVQGLTEFLPVSSSAHLVIAQSMMPNFQQPGVAFDVALHVGTLGAVILYYFRDIARMVESFVLLLRRKTGGDPLHASNNRMTGLVVLGSIPTAIIGLTAKDWVEHAFQSVTLVAGALLITGVLLWLSDMVRSATRKEGELTMRDSLLIGVVQGVAIVPGISRSGSTITTGLFMGIAAQDAAKFSFLLSIPAILGATMLSFRDLESLASSEYAAYAIGAVVSMFTGFAAIRVLIEFAKRQKLRLFAYYCWALGGSVLLYRWLA